MDKITLEGKLIICGKIKTETGLHIGGTAETLKIGGPDNPVIKDKNGNVFIPGSSLKGKIRSLLEKKYGQYGISWQFFKKNNENKDELKRKINIFFEYNQKNDKLIKKMKIEIKGNKKTKMEKEYDPKELNLKFDEDYSVISGIPCDCGSCFVCKLFGPHNSKNIREPVRVIFRDGFLINKKTNKPLTKFDKEYNNYFEIKPENNIDRVKGTAKDPRFIERVVAGSEFNYEVVFNIYDKEDKELIKKFIEGMKLLEDDYLGGSGSRGYGKIKFEKLKAIYKPKEYYEGDMDKMVEKPKIDDLDELIKLINEINF